MAADVNARGKIAQFHRSCGREIRSVSFLPESEPQRRRDTEEERLENPGKLTGSLFGMRVNYRPICVATREIVVISPGEI